MRRNFLIFLLTALAVVALDQLSKWLVIQTLPLGVPLPGPDTVIGRFASLTHVHNTGVAFGLFRGNNGLFTLLALAVTVAIAVYERQLPVGERWPRVALGLIAGGAVGNIIDRVRYGYVTDFLDVKFWPVFNVADSCVVVGVLLLTWYLWRLEQEPGPEALPAVPAPAPPDGSA